LFARSRSGDRNKRVSGGESAGFARWWEGLATRKGGLSVVGKGMSYRRDRLVG